jgi:hypothetical protein
MLVTARNRGAARHQTSIDFEECQMNRKNVCLVAAAVAGLALSANVGAVEVTRVVISNSTNFCQTALPVQDTNVRKRATTVVNEGSGSAFVSCSFHSENVVEEAEVWVHNDNATATDVTCTGVIGYNGNTLTSSKTVTVDPDGAQNVFSWTPADFEGFGSSLFSMSCVLPPGVGIDDTYIVYSEEIGATEPAAP